MTDKTTCIEYPECEYLRVSDCPEGRCRHCCNLLCNHDAATPADAPPPPSFMTLRDFFAGQALNGLLSWSPPTSGEQYTPERAAEKAFEFADAMIARRNQT